MRKTLAVTLVLAFVAIGCGTPADTAQGSTVATEAPAATNADPAVDGSPEDPPSTDGTTQVTEASPSTMAEPGGDEPSRVAEGPDVPGITLALDNGETVDVANAGRPLMLVFWAEW